MPNVEAVWNFEWSQSRKFIRTNVQDQEKLQDRMIIIKKNHNPDGSESRKKDKKKSRKI